MTVSPDYVGPYRIDRRRGCGGMGEVYAGFDARLDRPVALEPTVLGLLPGDRQCRFSYVNTQNRQS